MHDTDISGAGRAPLEGAHGVTVEHFRLLDPDLVDDKFWPLMDDIRDRCPVGHSSEGNFWLLSNYDDVYDACHDWRTYSSAQGAIPVQFDLDVLRMIPLETDPPVHREVRRVLSEFFTPSALRAAEPRVKLVVEEFMERCVAKSPCDFMAEFALVLPPHMFFELFVSGEDPSEISWIIEIVHGLVAEPESAAARAPQLLEWCGKLLDARYAQGRHDDAIGAIAHMGRDKDFQLSDKERMETLFLLVQAGMDTTALALGHIARLLASDVELRLKLRQYDRTQLVQAVDEFLRFEPPVPYMARTLTEDVEIGGCPISKGERVLLNFAAANRDPSVFENPLLLDVERPNAAKQLAFSTGVHRCLGVQLAVLELRLAIEAMCKLNVFELVPGTEVRNRVTLTRGPSSLPVVCR